MTPAQLRAESEEAYRIVNTLDARRRQAEHEYSAALNRWMALEARLDAMEARTEALAVDADMDRVA